jgi:transcriptional regulator with XRE-family HTH domain
LRIWSFPDRLSVRTWKITSSEFQKKFIGLRKAKNITQEGLAELVSVSVSTIKFIEQGQRAPSLPMLLKILYFLDRKARVW